MKKKSAFFPVDSLIQNHHLFCQSPVLMASENNVDDGGSGGGDDDDDSQQP